MARVRKISRRPRTEKNWFVVDACFLANRFIPPDRAPVGIQRDRIVRCAEWWDEIEDQLARRRARVYIPDICIAEAFKVLAKKYYKENWFRNSQDYNYYRSRLRSRISTPVKELRRAGRHISYHDIPSTRDIIVAVDRFYELYFRHGKTVSVPDLIVVATAKYLMDFFDASKASLHIVTLDRQLRDGSKKILELPNAHDPTMACDARDRVFAG